jgi:hypothetical protein
MGMMVATTTGTRTGLQQAGQVVWLIDPEHWLRALLRAELIERGYDAIGFTSMEDAIFRLAVERHRRPRLVLVNLSGQQVTPGAIALLGAGGVPVLGIGSATEPAAGGLALSAVLRRPMSLGQVADAIEQALTPH